MTETTTKPRRTWTILAGAVVVGLGLGVGAIYGIGGFERNASAGEACAASTAAAARIAPLARGQVAALIPAQSPLSVADLAFTADGRAVTLADWKGRTVLLNLWATWCVPCRLEMPALARLDAALGADDFQVVAVNVDTKDPDKPKRFLAEAGIERLGTFADPTLAIFKTLQKRGRARGMPATMLVGPDGCEIGTMNGPAEWDHRDALALIRAAMGKPSEAAAVTP